MTERRLSAELVAAVRRYGRSVLAFLVIGILVAGVLTLRQLQLETATVDIAVSNDLQLLVGQNLPADVADDFDAQQESFYINHAYSGVDDAFDGVTASVAGEAVVVSASRESADDALAAVDAFLVEYLERRNAPTLAAYETALVRAEELSAFYGSEVERLDAALQDPSLSESARNELAVQRTNIFVQATASRADASSFRQLAEGDGPIVVVDGPRVASSGSASRLLLPIVALLLIAGIGIAQAWFRDTAKPAD